MLKKTFLLSVLLVFILIASVSAQDGFWKQYVTKEEYQQSTGNVISGYNEAPQLKEMVKSGDILPVAERLPKEPMVVSPVNEIGKYGGTFVRGWKGLSDQWGVNKPFGERFTMFNSEGQVIPNVAKGWEVSADKKSVTFFLREGMKWSDGVPITTDDVLFWANDLILYEELASVPVWPGRGGLIYGGKEAVFEKIDDYTFKVTFAIPVANTFITDLAKWCPTSMLAPKHYLKQFHPKYTSKEELDKLVAESGLDDWVQLFDEKEYWLTNPDLPVVFAWKVTNSYTDPILRLTRNPYYFKIDTAGNQLPYVDGANILYIEDPEVMKMKALTGDINFQARHFALSDYPTFVENADKGNYRVLLYPTATGSNVTLTFNHTAEDPVKRELFNNLKFKEAISHAIDRDQINDLIYLDTGVPMQASYISKSPFYDEEWANQAVEYDPELSKKLLDEIGLKVGPDGYRLNQNGEQLQLVINGGTGLANEVTDMAELIKADLENIGLDVRLEILERTLYRERISANKLEIYLRDFMDKLRPDLHVQDHLVPMNPEQPAWGPEYAVWYQSDGKEGVEPPADVKKLFALGEELLTTSDFDRTKEIMQEIADIHKKNLYIIGTVGEVPIPLIVSKDLRNVPERAVDTELYRNIGRVLPQQMYFEK